MHVYHETMGKKEFFKFIDVEGTVRLRFKITVSLGRVSGVVVQLEINTGGEWRPVVRYDNAHGVLHRDMLDPAGSETKSVVQLPDFESFLSFSEQDLVDRWQWYRDVFLTKLRRQGRKR